VCASTRASSPGLGKVAEKFVVILDASQLLMLDEIGALPALAAGEG